MNYKFRGTATGENGYTKGKTYCGVVSYDVIDESREIIFEDEHGWNFVPATNIALFIATDTKGVDVYDGDDVWHGKDSADVWKASFADLDDIRDGDVFAYTKK